MTQIGSTKRNRSATKISLNCLLITLLGIAVSTLLLFHRFQHATRQQHQQQLRPPPKPPMNNNPISQKTTKTRKTLQEMETESYMKTGRKPKHIDKQFSNRHIEGNRYEIQQEEVPHPAAAVHHQRREEEADPDPIEGHRQRFPERQRHQHPEEEEHHEHHYHHHKTHFYVDAPPAAEDNDNNDKDPPHQDGDGDNTPATAQLLPEYVYKHWKHGGKFPDNTPSFLAEFEHNNPIHFLDYTQLSRQDTFSASWIQRRREFMDMPLQRIQICEDAAWEAWVERPHKLRMTLDTMDFSVEHLSKWWKFLSFYNTPIAYNSIIEKLTAYIKRGHQFPTPPVDELMMPNTLTMIAFQPYLHKKETDKHYNLTVTSLAATLESIRRAQIGRVVIVGLVNNGYDIAQEAFHYLANHIPAIRHQIDSSGVVTKIGHMEVGYARGSATIAKSKHLEKNIPRAVLYGTKMALQLGDIPASQRQPNETLYVQEWLGDEHSPAYWKYLYLTEPDTILNVRANALPQLKAQLDRGMVLSPHRLQPIPHESDLKGLANNLRYLNLEDGFNNVWHLDETRDVCCDEMKGPDRKPGKDESPGVYKTECTTWWYMCGFKKDYKDKSNLGDVHERLRPYQLMKLKGGTGLTLLAGNLFGRRCFPAKDTKCLPPTSPLEEATKE